jgi:hypothetical protein
MTEIATTYAHYAIDRRFIVDFSRLYMSEDFFISSLKKAYGWGVRRFVVSPCGNAIGIASDPYYEVQNEICTSWLSLVYSFVQSCSHPVTVGVRYDLGYHMAAQTSLLSGSFMDYELPKLVNNGITAIVSDNMPKPSDPYDPYDSCTNRLLKQILERHMLFYLWRDNSGNPYVSTSGACDLPEWYDLPVAVSDSTLPVSGWASANVRASVESVVTIESEDLSERVIRSCVNWGYVPCWKPSVSSLSSDWKYIVDAYLDEERRVKDLGAKSKKFIVPSLAGRRSHVGVGSCHSFFSSIAKSIPSIVAPANIDCSSSANEAGGVCNLPSYYAARQPYYEDPLMPFTSAGILSSKISSPSAYGSYGACKAADAAIGILAEEWSSHPQRDYLGEFASVLVFSDWGRGGSSQVVDTHYEECRLTEHAGDALSLPPSGKSIQNPRDSLFNYNGILSCRSWMSKFIYRFETVRQRWAVFIGVGVQSPWCVVFNSKLPVDINSAVSQPKVVDGITYYGNWESHIFDSRWEREVIADIFGSEKTLLACSEFSRIYSVKSYLPGGQLDKTFTANNVFQNRSAFDFVGNRAFAKWYMDVARAAAAFALNESVGKMLVHHFVGCSVSSPGLTPKSSQNICDHKDASPLFSMVQYNNFSSPSLTPSPRIGIPHVGIFGQGHKDVPPLSEGVRVLTKCSSDGDQLSDWYLSSPVGDCSWRFGGERERFGFGVDDSEIVVDDGDPNPVAIQGYSGGTAQPIDQAPWWGVYAGNFNPTVYLRTSKSDDEEYYQ